MENSIEISVPDALDLDGLDALEVALRQAEGQSGRVVVLRGGPQTFCRGLDVLAFEDMSLIAGTTKRFVDLILSIRRSEKIFIALVEGAAYGGGVGLAAVCDVVLATEDASFGLPEVLIGLAPLTIWPLLCERMPAQKVRRMALAAHGHSAAQAHSLGLVDELVSAERMPGALSGWLRTASRGQSGGVAAIKRLPQHSRDLELSLRSGARQLEELLATDSAIYDRARALQRGEFPWSVHE